jgi:hypothetical protein
MGQLAQATFKTPEQVLMERQQQRQQMYSAAQSPYERMGMALGNILGQAFGVKDPALERASLTQQIYNDTLSMNQDINSSDFYNTLAKNLSAAGLAPEAAYSIQEGRKYNLEERRMAATEAQVAQGEKRLQFDKERLQADVAREARQGRLTEAQIRQIDAQIANLGSAYEYQVIKGPAGETVSILAINKKNPSDVRTINTTPDAASMPSAPVSAGEWNYVPGQGLVKGK